jgi:hypothetical protein
MSGAQAVFASCCVLLGSMQARAESNPAQWPKRYSFFTLPSGRTYKVVNSGPMFGKENKRLGMSIAYVSSARSFEDLKTAAQDLFELMRPLAEKEHDESVIVMAKLGFDPDATFNRSIDFGIVYQHDASGTWHRLQVDGTKPFPDVAPPSDATAPDLHAEATAKIAAEAWLAIFDSGKLDESWNVASPYLKTTVTKADWMKLGSQMGAALGKVVSRKPMATMATATVPSAPPGKYVSFEFHTAYAKRASAIEDVLEMLCDDGKWRLAGYAVR